MDTFIQQQLEQHQYPLLFATITGSRAFGYSTYASDYDIHGVHLLSTEQILGLDQPQETIERKLEHPDDVEMDISTHELKKFILLLLKGNGNILEDLYSPLVLVTSPLHEELKELGQGCITKRCSAHYKGMAFTQQRKLASNELKKLIHTYRCLLMGIYLMRTGKILMDVPTLAEEYGLPQLQDLLDYKQDKTPHLHLSTESHLQIIEHLTGMLDTATQESQLPEEPTTRKELERLLVRTRLGSYVHKYGLIKMCQIIEGKDAW